MIIPGTAVLRPAVIAVLLLWSGVGSQAGTLEIEGLLKADGYDVAVASSDRVTLSGGSPQVVWMDQKSGDKITVRSPEITVLWRKGAADSKEPAGVDRVVLKGDRSTVVSTLRGFSLEASEVTVVAAKVKGAGAIDRALAGGKVRLAQSEGAIMGDAEADTLEIKDGGDTAILTGNAVMNYTNPQYKGKITGDVIKITEILPRDGKPADPLIRAEKMQTPAP